MSKFFCDQDNENIICPHNKLQTVIYADEPIRLKEISHLKKLGEENSRTCKDCHRIVCNCIWSKTPQNALRSTDMRACKLKTIPHEMDSPKNRVAEIIETSKHSLNDSHSVHWIMRPNKMRISNPELVLNLSTDPYANHNYKRKSIQLYNNNSRIEPQKLVKQDKDVAPNPKIKESFVYLIQDPTTGSCTQVKQFLNTKLPLHQLPSDKNNISKTAIIDEYINLFTKNTKNFFNEKRRNFLDLQQSHPTKKHFKNEYTMTKHQHSLVENRNESKAVKTRCIHNTWPNMVKSTENLHKTIKYNLENSNRLNERDSGNLYKLCATNCDAETFGIFKNCKQPDTMRNNCKVNLTKKSKRLSETSQTASKRIIVKDQHAETNASLTICSSTTAQASCSLNRLKDFAHFKEYFQEKRHSSGFKIQTVKVSEKDRAKSTNNANGLSTYEVEITLGKMGNESLLSNKIGLKKFNKKRINNKQKLNKKPKNTKVIQDSNITVQNGDENKVKCEGSKIENKDDKQQATNDILPIQNMDHTKQPNNLHSHGDAPASSTPQKQLPITKNKECEPNGKLSNAKVHSSAEGNNSHECDNELPKIKSSLSMDFNDVTAIRDTDAEIVCNLVNSVADSICTTKLNSLAGLNEKDEKLLKTENILETPIRKCIRDYSGAIIKKRLRTILKNFNYKSDAAQIRAEICNLLPKNNLSIATLRNKDYTISFHAPVSMAYRCGRKQLKQYLYK